MGIHINLHILAALAAQILTLHCPALTAELLKNGAYSGSTPGSRTGPLRVAEVLALQKPSGGTVGGASTNTQSASSEILQNQGTLPQQQQYSKNNVLRYFRGPLVVTTSQIHVIYYGSWARNNLPRIRAGIQSFVDSISASSPTGPGTVSSWWKLNSLLAQKDGKRATTEVFLKSELFDNYSQGKNLKRDTDKIFAIVKRQLDLRKITHTPGAMYIVITSPDVVVGDSAMGFCSVYCGWHDYKQYMPPGFLKRQDIYYGFVGDPSTQCPGACGISDPTPRGTIDPILDTFAHEIAEIATDPDAMTGWLTDQSSAGQENCDLCRRSYNNQRSFVSNGVSYKYNLVGVNGAKFMIQANYNPVKAQCTMWP